MLLSDGEDTGGPDAVGRRRSWPPTAGVHIETVGVGTAEGATIEVDGFQVAPRSTRTLLTQIAQTTGGSYHRADDAAALDDVYQVDRPAADHQGRAGRAHRRRSPSVAIAAAHRRRRC